MTPPTATTSAPKTSFRSVKDRTYAEQYMMDEQLAMDRRKARIDRVEQAIVGRLIDALPPDSTVADVPSGNGRMTHLVQRPDLKVLALDFNHSMLVAMAGRGDLPLRATRAQADITALPLPDNCVDLFINMRLMHHIPDRPTQVRMCRQMVRVTRGRVVTSFWTTHCWRHLRKRVLGKKVRAYPVSPGYLRSICAEAGLAVKCIIPVHRWYEDECVAICEVA